MLRDAVMLLLARA